MSTTMTKTAQRAALAAIALVTAAGSAVEARAATVRGIDSYVPADRAATAPGALVATRASTVRVVEVRKDAQNPTAITARLSAKSR